MSLPCMTWRLAAAICGLVVAAGAIAQSAVPKPPRRPPPPSKDPVLPVASGEQLAAAAMAHFGRYDCEFDQSVEVALNARNDGYLEIRFKKTTWIMKPVLSHTGALRLEDVKGRMLMLQIADKSMLMDTQIGQRLVDNCVHEKQREATAARKAAGASAESIGIDPAKAAAPATPASGS